MSNPAPIRRAAVAASECGMARATDVIGDRWLLLILREAFHGVTRFDDLRAGTGAPRAVLSERLDRLVATGLLRREPYRDPGRRARDGYRLTAKGSELAPVIIALMQWGDRHLRDDAPPLAVVDARSREPLTVALATAAGRVVPLAAAELVVERKVVEPSGIEPLTSTMPS